MAIQLALKFDGGEKKYSKALQTTKKDIKDFSPLFRNLIDYFEGKTFFLGSPILEIWETKGNNISGNWDNDPDYEKWKEKNWDKVRKYNLPINFKHEQILTGKELSGLLNSRTEGAVRVIKKDYMAYGIENEYSGVQQENKHILDISTKMESGIDRVFDDYVNQLDIIRNDRDLFSGEF